jgi:hypothetical protein
LRALPLTLAAAGQGGAAGWIKDDAASFFQARQLAISFVSHVDTQFSGCKPSTRLLCLQPPPAKLFTNFRDNTSHRFDYLL